MGTIVPIIATIKDETDRGVPALTHLLQIEEDDLPELFAYHSASGKKVFFPGVLDEIKE